jgi:hypothetical protein
MRDLTLGVAAAILLAIMTSPAASRDLFALVQEQSAAPETPQVATDTSGSAARKQCVNGGRLDPFTNAYACPAGFGGVTRITSDVPRCTVDEDAVDEAAKKIAKGEPGVKGDKGDKGDLGDREDKVKKVIKVTRMIAARRANAAIPGLPRLDDRWDTVTLVTDGLEWFVFSQGR